MRRPNLGTIRPAAKTSLSFAISPFLVRPIRDFWAFVCKNSVCYNCAEEGHCKRRQKPSVGME